MSKVARNRWKLALLLLQNPSLRAFRRHSLSATFVESPKVETNNPKAEVDANHGAHGAVPTMQMQCRI